MRISRFIFPVMLGLVMSYASELHSQVFVATISATSETNICPGSSVGMRITFFGGTPPYDVVISDNNGIFMELPDIYGPYYFSITPETENTYYISDVYDDKGRKGYRSGAVTVTFRDATPVKIVSDRQAFMEDDEAHPLVSDPQGAVFSGPGVRDGMFYPAEAGSSGSPHAISCSYEDYYGCISTDEIEFYVLTGQSEVHFYQDNVETEIICDENGNYNIVGSNSDRLNGTFTLVKAGSGEAVEDHIQDSDLTDNRAVLKAAGLDGAYEIIYRYEIYGLAIESRCSFQFIPLEINGIRNFPEKICRTAAPIPLEPVFNPEDQNATWSFSGPGVSGSQDPGFFFDPASPEVLPGNVGIELAVNSMSCTAQAEFSIQVGEASTLEILSDRQAFLENSGEHELLSSPSGASFTGPGVENSSFHPSVAGTTNSPHTIYASYTNSFGCTSTDSIQFWVLSGISEVGLFSGSYPVDTLCDESAIYTIRGSNEDGLSGSFELLQQGSSTPIGGHILDEDPNDNEAILQAEGLEGSYVIRYSYGMEDLLVQASTEFVFTPLEAGGLHDFPVSVCQNEDPLTLLPELALVDPEAIWTFSGNGVSGSQEEGYSFDPSHPDVKAGNNEIILEFLSSNHCAAYAAFTILVGYVPELEFSTESVCISNGGSSISFRNESLQQELVDEWNWNFGDPLSGSDNTSTLADPDHFYGSPGTYGIQLEGTSIHGCKSMLQKDILLESVPEVNFNWGSDCYSEASGMLFQLEYVSDYSGLDSVWWRFYNGDGEFLEEVYRPGTEPDLLYHFPTTGEYWAHAEVISKASCKAGISYELKLIPSIPVSETGLVASFDGEGDQWMAGSAGEENYSWVRAEPDFSGYTGENGDLAWYTELPLDEPSYMEASWVQSPCYDLSQLHYPILSLDIMKSFVPGRDGALIQFQDSYHGTWQNLGTIASGVNWYNGSNIQYQPGGSSQGWTLEVFQPDQEWIAAKHSLHSLAGKGGVKFRIALASGGSESQSPAGYNQGFAFNNFSINESANRRSVLEYFTNVNEEQFYAMDTTIRDLARRYPGLIFDLHYHMDYPDFDPMNNNNPIPAATRSFYYGIPDAPFAVLNGGENPIDRFHLYKGTDQIDESSIIKSILEDPLFEINLDVNYMQDKLEGSAQIICSAPSYDEFMQLYLVVIEKEVLSYPVFRPDSSFRNVVLDILPSPAGQLLADDWTQGKSRQVDFSWNYAGYVEDVEDLSVVAFVQDRSQGRILQAANAPHTPEVSIPGRNTQSNTIHLYPNPAYSLLNITMERALESRSQLLFFDVSGRLVKEISVDGGNGRLEADISDLSDGMYVLLWKSGNTSLYRTTFIRRGPHPVP